MSDVRGFAPKNLIAAAMSAGALVLLTACGGEDASSVDAGARGKTAPDPVEHSEQETEEEKSAPRLVTIDDLKDTLLPVVFTPTENGLRAAPTLDVSEDDGGEGEGPKGVIREGRLAFWVPEGTQAEDYRNFAHFAAGKGWSVHVLNGDASLDDFDAEHEEATCTVLGAVGPRQGRALLEYGMERMGSVDGLLLAGFIYEDDARFKKRLPIAVISGGEDGVAPCDEVTGQYKQWPGQTYFLTIDEANHGGYYEGRTFENDGEARVPPLQQRLILGEIAAKMTDRFCRTRESRLADEKRKAERAAAKAKGE